MIWCGFHVSGPSISRIQSSGKSRSRSDKTFGVRSRIGIAWFSLKSSIDDSVLYPNHTLEHVHQLLFLGSLSWRSGTFAGVVMLARALALICSATLVANADSLMAQVTAPPRIDTVAAARRPLAPDRPIRRDLPQTNMIKRAYAAGTRDQSGRPGPRYWQLWTNYTIRARLDSATSRVTGTESVSFRNNSDSAMRSIVLRLDQNIFRPDAPRTSIMDAVTSGMKVTRLVVNGQSLSVTDTIGNPIPGSDRRTTPLSRILRGTSARIPLATPIPAHGTGTFEADWSFEVPRIEGARGF